MDIGTAIKEVRKRKGFSQKEFAAACDISVNTLCQIEINNSFPQKTTIRKICEVLEIPVSYLLFFSITEEDVPEEKRLLFNALGTPLRDALADSVPKRSVLEPASKS